MRFIRHSVGVAALAIGVAGLGQVSIASDGTIVGASGCGASELDAALQRSAETGTARGVPAEVLLEAEAYLRQNPPSGGGSEQGSDVPIAVLELCSDPNFVGQQVCFDGTDSFTPDGSQISLLYITFDDGGYYVGEPQKVFHSFSMVNTYDVHLQVMNAMGIWGDQQELNLALDYRPPTPCYTIQSENLNSATARIELDARCSEAFDGQRVEAYRWDYCVSVRGSGQQCYSSDNQSISIDVLRSSSTKLNGTLVVRDTRGKEGELQLKTTLSSGK